jgi:hypothetical protein
VVNALPEQTEASLSVDPLGSFGTYVMLELKESGNGVVVLAPEKEGQGAEESGLLHPKLLEPANLSMSSLPIEENYVGFEVFTAVVLKSIIFWDMTPFSL